MPPKAQRLMIGIAGAQVPDAGTPVRTAKITPVE